MDRHHSNLVTLADELGDLAAGVGAALGVAVAPLSAPAEVIGTVRTGAAWSTAKVPLAMASLAAHPGSRTDSLVARAIRDSDNEAAQSLWDAWPDPGRAAAAVRDVLRDAGDASTEVPHRRRRAGYSIVGQTEWSLAAQARFGAELSCLSYGPAVLAQMERVSSGQRWGFAAPAITERLDRVAVKGGWGPDEAGDYLVRQLAVVTPHRGAPWATALAARPDTGQFGAGTEALTAAADWLLQRLRVTGPRRCR